ncbi:MAG: hypothetical protein QM811_16875 [Pirellulales bacterium]
MPGQGFTFKGAYNAGTAYLPYDVVAYGVLRTCASARRSETCRPTRPIGRWLAAKGTDGSNGTNGTNGSNGAAGQGFTFKGGYAGGTAYVPYDVVAYGGAAYVCVANTTGNLPTNPTYWTLFSAKGTDGTNGTNGTNGSDGAMASTAKASTSSRLAVAA